MEMYTFLGWSRYICFYICSEIVFSFQACLLHRISKVFSLFELYKKTKAEEPKNLDFNDMMVWVNAKNKRFRDLPYSKVQHLQDNNKKLVNFIKQIK